MKPLDLGELLSHVSSVAHHLGLVGEVAGPVIFWAQRLSSVVFGTAILLVWRPHYLLPLILLKLCILLLHSSPDVPNGSAPDAVPAKPSRDPALSKVMKAAETGLPAHQYHDISIFQNNLGACVESIMECRRLWQQAVAHKFSVCATLGLLDVALIYFSAWQGLLLRMALTSVFAFLLAKHSCLARVMRALYIYKSKDTALSSGCFGLGVTLEPLALPHRAAMPRVGTCHLTPNATAQLSNSSPSATSNSNSTSAAKPSMHILEETSWSEPTWCKHCGGFLWGVYRQGWTCRECGVVLCHACAAENHLDFCPKSKSK